jgi:hypothetical protein
MAQIRNKREGEKTAGMNSASTVDAMAGGDRTSLEFIDFDVLSIIGHEDSMGRKRR